MNTLEGYVHVDIIKTLNTFLDFCYITHQNVLSEASLDALDVALGRFHHYREIFRASGMRPDGFSLPRQHSLKHYRQHIGNFGAPNGLCSSITESKHIIAVKKPWRQSGCYEALQQMLVRNMVFFELFLCCSFTISMLFHPPTFFSLSFTLQEKTIRVLLIP